MRLLAVPGWSFGRDRRLLSDFRDVLNSTALSIHYCASDVDHNRTVTAVSGEPDEIKGAVLDLCGICFDSIDLNRHVGTHPRVGGLDVCPIVVLDDDAPTGWERAHTLARELAAAVADRFDVPAYLYEKSEQAHRPESELPTLREGGFGGLLGVELRPDYGPNEAHPRLGVSVFGAMDFFITVSARLQQDSAVLGRNLASQVQDLRAAGDPRFLGVYAAGNTLSSRGQGELLLTLTLPNITDVDSVLKWIILEASRTEVALAGAELIGAIRKRDLASASRMVVSPEQVTA